MIPARRRRLSRRRILAGAGAAGLATLASRRPGHAQTPPRHLPITRSASPLCPWRSRGQNHQDDWVQRTFRPLLRLREGNPSHQRHQHSGYPNLIHWHGCSFRRQDGATEEGSPLIPPESRCSIHSRRSPPARAGTTAMHGDDGSEPQHLHCEFGFLIIEPPRRPGHMTANHAPPAHHWKAPGSACRTSTKAAADKRPGGDTMRDMHRMLGQGEPSVCARGAGAVPC